MAKRKVQKAKKKNPAQMIFTRFMLVVAFFILWIGGISIRLVHLQVNQHEFLLGKALEQRRFTVKNKLLRGTIYDRSERKLAMSIEARSLFADPSEIEDVEKTAREVAKVLKVKTAEILKPLREAKENNRRFVWLARKLDEPTVQKINDTLQTADLKKYDLPKFAGLHWKQEQKRSYPYNSLAAQVIGFSNSDDTGLAGIEQSQEEHLHGAIIKSWRDRDRLGRVYDEEEAEEREPPKDIVLTISHSIQYKVEQALADGVKKSGSKSGMAIVLDPKTGEVLALANYPAFDPNKYADYKAESYTNRAIHDVYSPGSVFKLVTYSAALNENLISPEMEFDCGRGVLKLPGREIFDKHCQQKVSYSKALAVSSNIAAMKTGFRIGKDNFYGYIRNFGFGKPTGIELPAETGGIVRPPEVWDGGSLASMSIGYEISVSALQMAAAFATIANDGVKIQPHIIKEIRQADGKVFSAAEPERTQVISRETAVNLRKMLRQVVLSGTGKRAQLNGYTSAGKTGTAWKYNPELKKVDSGKYISSFIGMAPVDDPAVVIAVVMDEPKGGARDGGQVSAPVFREIAEHILPELHVIPDAAIRQEVLTAEQIPSETEVQPPFNNKEQTADNLDTNQVPEESEKENKPPGENKKPVKPKTAINSEKPKNETKNKSPGERKKQKT